MACGELSLEAAGPSLGVNLTKMSVAERIMSVAERWDTCAGSVAAHTHKVPLAVEDEPALGASLPYVRRAMCDDDADDDAEPSLGAGLPVMSVVKRKAS